MTAGLLTHALASTGQTPALSAAQWESLLGQARQTRLLGRLAQHHADHGGLAAVPPQPRHYLNGALKLVDRHRHEVQWEVESIRRALQHLCTPVVLLKGAAYCMAGLPPRRGRIFADIDIMVERGQLPQVESALLRCGWISEERDPYNERYYRQWMHEIPPKKHVQRGTTIDVHHTITPPTSRFAVDGARLMQAIQPLPGHAGLYILAPTDMVLHSAVHLFQEGEFSHGLRDLLDIKDLLLHFGKDPAFFTALFARARALGLGQPLYYAMHHTDQLFATRWHPYLQHELHRVQPGPIRRRLLNGLLGSALQPQHPSCTTPWNGLARWLLYVRSHHLRMPWHLLIPHLARKAYLRRRHEKPDATLATPPER